MNAKKIWGIFKGTFAEFSEDNVMRLSAALAYYAMFSIGPLLVIVVGVAGIAFNHARHDLEKQLQIMLGPKAAETISSMMVGPKHGALITTIVGVVALLFGAGGVFGALQDSLNTIWEVKPKPGIGIWGLIRARFLSLSMVFGTGFLLLVSMALTTFLSTAAGWLGALLGISEVLIHIVNFIVSFGIITALFAMIFKYLPDVRVPFRKVWIGAILTSLLFTAGKYGLAMYLGRASTSSSYGAAGSVIIVLMWVYYASLILFFGAEFTQVYAKETGTQVVPRRYAMRITEEERAQEGIPHDGSPAPQGAAAPAEPEPALQPAPQFATPGVVIRRRPWQFVSLMLFAGFAGGALLKFKSLRKAVRLYAALDKT